MEEYVVLKYDDGIYACVSKKEIKSSNGHHCAKWKNAYYNVQVIKSGNKHECESFITLKKAMMDEKDIPIPTFGKNLYLFETNSHCVDIERKNVNT